MTREVTEWSSLHAYQFQDVSFLASLASSGSVRPRPPSGILVSSGRGHRSQPRLLPHVPVQVTQSGRRGQSVPHSLKSGHPISIQVDQLQYGLTNFQMANIVVIGSYIVYVNER